MVRKSIIFVCLLVMLGITIQSVSAQNSAPKAQCIPPDAILTLEITDPAALLDFLLSPNFQKAVTSTPAYQASASQPGFQEFQQVIAYIEMLLGTDWKSAIREVFGGGATLAVLPEDRVMMIVDSNNKGRLEQLHEIFLGFARDDAQKQGQYDRVKSREYNGQTIWTFGGDDSHTIAGNRFLWANHPDTLDTTLDLHNTSNGQSIANKSAFQSARNAIRNDATAFSFINMALLNQFPPIRDSLTTNLNPLLALLLAEIPEILLNSNGIALDLKVDLDNLNLQIIPEGKMADISAVNSFAIPQQTGQGVWPNISVPRQIAGLSFYRDIYRFYAAKDELFPERTSGLIFFENMMGIFFTGRDLTEEVWAETQPELRIVVAEQDYDPSIGTPRVHIPSFAAIFRMRNPQTFSQVAEEAWQKALGLINFTRGQQALPGLLIDKDFHADKKFSYAYFSSLDEESKVNLESRYNFRPSIVTLDEYLVLSSTDGLAKDLIDSLQKEKAASVTPIPNTHSMVEVDAKQLTSILEANKENIIRQNMLEKGHTKEQAESEIGMLFSVIQNFEGATLQVGNQDGQLKANLNIALDLPKGEQK